MLSGSGIRLFEGVDAGLAGGPLLTGIGVQQAGFTAAMIIATIVLALLGAASLIRLPATASAERSEGPDT